MTLRRAVLYIGGAALLVAWFSSAASLSLSRQERRPGPDGDQASAPVEELLADVQQQTRRLRDHMAAAPRPATSLRNPFRFRDAPSPGPAGGNRRDPIAHIPPLPVPPPEPALALVGVAEQTQDDGVVRTALLVNNGDDLIMAMAGAVVLARYTVITVGADWVELSDTATGQTRRLALQAP